MLGLFIFISLWSNENEFEFWTLDCTGNIVILFSGSFDFVQTSLVKLVG